MAVIECSTIAFERTTECARQARAAVVEVCRGLARDLIEIAQLLTSELVTNALNHGTGTIEVEVSRSRNCLRVSVDDGDPTTPRRLPASAEATNGRGLLLVEALAARWGVTQQGTGKRVWFELRTA